MRKSRPTVQATHTLCMRVPPTAHAVARRLAEDQGTSMTEVILQLLQQAARSAGYDEQPFLDTRNQVA